MEQGRFRGAYRGADADLVDLGNEPPLSVDGETTGLVDRRRISIQWFSGTILTGLCGAALMAGAVFASLDGEAYFATRPDGLDAGLRGAFGPGDRTASVARKSSRLPPPGELSVHRQELRTSTITKVGDREVVRVHPLMHVSGNLAMSVSDISANIPPFNPQQLLADTSPETPTATEAEPGVEPDAEVSFVTRDLSEVLGHAKIAGKLPAELILERVREAATWVSNAGPQTAVNKLRPALGLAYAATGDASDPYAGIEARIVPENITMLPKTTPLTTGGNPAGEKTLTVRKGDTLASILTDAGATETDIKAIIDALGEKDSQVSEGQRLRLLMLPEGPGQQPRPFRVVVLDDDSIQAVVALSDLGRYASVDVSSMDMDADLVADTGEDDDGSGVRLYRSIYETALRNDIPHSVVDDMVRIYSYDIDFQRKVQPGDWFDVLYRTEEDADNNGRLDVVYAALTLGGETHKFYLFRTPDDGVYDYYDETGKSAKKFLVRKPVVEGRLTGGFGMRKHPILGYVKMHTGIDWAAPHGTPIFASGNGVVEIAERKGGYGKYVRIRHANGYETAYGHMTAFAKGITEGVHVTQGQVIGYVGSTGLSTGSHLHYEILINGRFVDPMRIKLPRGRTLDGRFLAAFDKERARIDKLVMRSAAPEHLAQTAAR